MDLRKLEQTIDKYHLYKLVQITAALLLAAAAILAALLMRYLHQH